MGGHGGLNILPQKRWNVYNFDNREKVKNDEEAAAKEEQLKREQSRKRDAEHRLEQLRTARGLAPALPEPSASSASASASAPPVSVSVSESASPPVSAPPVSDSRHINLFEGIKIFDISDLARKGEEDVEKDAPKKKRMKKEEPAPRVVTEEDEKYRLGYGVAGKGVKLPWYLAKPSDGKNDESGGDKNMWRSGKDGGKSGGKKTIEELREERLKREKREKERTRVLIHDKDHRDVPMAKDRYFSRRWSS